MTTPQDWKPEAGAIVRLRDLGRPGAGHARWTPCPDCGVGRWAACSAAGVLLHNDLCKSCAQLARLLPFDERQWAKVEESPSGCWLWTGRISINGYGRVDLPHRRRMPAHRWTYEYVVGKIPEGLQLDHLCYVRRCVNPAHLEPVTNRENHRRAAERRRRLAAAA